MAQTPELSVIIPTYREAHRLGRTLAEIWPYLDARFRGSFEIVIVDDESPDATRDIALGFKRGDPRIRVLVQSGRIGKGAAVRRGCLESEGRLVLFMDADHSTPIESLEACLRHAEGQTHALVSGTRTYQEDESKWRRIIGLTALLLAHLIVFEKAVVDSQCGFKLLTRGAVNLLFSRARVNGGMFDVELFFLAHRLNVPTFFVPVLWKNKPGSTINVLACLVRDPLELVRIRVRDWLGRYPKRVEGVVAAPEAQAKPKKAA